MAQAAEQSTHARPPLKANEATLQGVTERCPVLALADRLRQQYEVYSEGLGDTPRCDRNAACLDALQATIMCTPATSLEGLYIQLVLAARNLSAEDHFDNETSEEGRKLLLTNDQLGARLRLHDFAMQCALLTLQRLGVPMPTEIAKAFLLPKFIDELRAAS